LHKNKVLDDYRSFFTENLSKLKKISIVPLGYAAAGTLSETLGFDPQNPPHFWLI